jgi:hypothetical protein
LLDEYAYFKVTGSGDCENVTKILKRKPNKSWSEGDLRPNGRGVYTFMMWQQDSGLEKTSSIEHHIENLFMFLNNNALAIRNLAPDYECIIQCVGHFDSSHGVHIRPDQVRQAAHMGIGFSMDFYASKELENNS